VPHLLGPCHVSKTRPTRSLGFRALRLAAT
jgi:hypothetical protein